MVTIKLLVNTLVDPKGSITCRTEEENIKQYTFILELAFLENQEENKAFFVWVTKFNGFGKI